MTSNDTGASAALPADDVIWRGSFTDDEVREFADLSGDHNPIHVDGVAARRLLFGRPVVHGMAGVLTALDAYAAHGGDAPGRLQVAFRRPMLMGTAIEVVRSAVDPDGTRLVIRSGGEDLTILTLTGTAPGGHEDTHEQSQPVAASSRPGRAGTSTTPAERTFGDGGDQSGVLSVLSDQARFAARYPAAWSSLGPLRAQALATLSRLVGMVLPGRHSLFTGLDVSLAAQAVDHVLAWSLERARAPIAPITIEVSGAGLHGTVEALFRPAPVRQPSMAQVATDANVPSLSGQRVLVVGGSRGLGELLAKITARAGADVTITYVRGRADAERVAAEIRDAGFLCAVAQVEADELAEYVARSAPFAHVYYLATPPITRDMSPASDATDDYRRIYVTAFAQLVTALGERGARTTVLYPSTTYVTQAPPGLSGYVAAKSAGEALCIDLQDRYPGLRILVQRLPPMATDQTNALVQRAPQPTLPLARDIVVAMIGA